jgi:hypothetical protein
MLNEAFLMFLKEQVNKKLSGSVSKILWPFTLSSREDTIKATGQSIIMKLNSNSQGIFKRLLHKGYVAECF